MPSRMEDRIQKLRQIEQDSQLSRAADIAGKMADKFERAMLGRQLEPSEHPFPDAPTSINTGNIRLGTTLEGGAITVDSSIVFGLATVLGRPGCGKSNLASRLTEQLIALHRIPVCYVDLKYAPSETPFDIPLPVLSPAEAAMSLAPPPGITLSTWFAKICDILKSCMWLQFAASNLTAELNERVLPNLHDGEPCFADLHHALSTYPPRRGEEKHLRKTALEVAKTVAANSEGAFSTREMLPWDRRIASPHAIMLSQLPAEAQFVYVYTLANGFLHHQAAQGVNQREIAFEMVIDDARVAGKNPERKAQIGISPLQDLVDKGESRGLALMLIVQSTAELSETTLQSADTIICIGPADPTDAEAIGRRAGFNREQREYLQRQGKHDALLITRRIDGLNSAVPFRPTPPPVVDQALVASKAAEAKRILLANRWPKPWVPIDPWSGKQAQSNPKKARAARQKSGPKAQPRQKKGSAANGAAKPRPEGAKQRSKPQPQYQSQTRTTGKHTPVSAKPSQPPDTAVTNSAPPIGPQALALLKNTARYPHLIQSEHAHALKIAGRKLTNARNELEGYGFITVAKLAGTRIWECTPLAAQFLDYNITPMQGRGKLPHRFLQARIKSWRVSRGDDVVLEKEWPGETVWRIDVFTRSPTGVLSAWEVALSTSNLQTSVLPKLASFTGDTYIVVNDAASKAKVGQLAGSPITIYTAKQVLTLTKPHEL